MKLTKVTLELEGKEYAFTIDREVSEWDTLSLDLNELVRKVKGKVDTATVGVMVTDTDALYVRKSRR